jgi:uncharacterized membrane protein
VFVALRSVAVTVILLSYPYLVYLGIEKGNVWFAPALISGFYLYHGIKAQDAKVKWRKITLALVLIVGAIFFQSVTAKLFPIVIQLMLMYFFGKTLINGPPLIERFVRLEFPDFILGIAEYCRQLTWLWTGFFAFNAVMCTVLAFWAPSSWWAIYNGILIFVMTGLIMVGEDIWRLFKFPEMEIPSVRSSAKNMMENGRKIWRDVHVN